MSVASNPVLEQIKDLMTSALSDSDERRAGQTALRAIRALRAANVVLSAPSDSKKFPGLQTKTQAAGRVLESSYDGRCKDCGDRYCAGDKVFWVKNDEGSKVFCLDCARSNGLTD